MVAERTPDSYPDFLKRLEGLVDALTGVPLDPSQGLYQCRRCKAYYQSSSIEVINSDYQGRCPSCSSTSFIRIRSGAGIQFRQATPNQEVDESAEGIARKRPIVAVVVTILIVSFVIAAVFLIGPKSQEPLSKPGQGTPAALLREPPLGTNTDALPKPLPNIQSMPSDTPTKPQQATAKPAPAHSVKSTNKQDAQPTEEIRLGLKESEVIAIFGKPDKIEGPTWFYGTSSLTISQQKVIGYNDKGELSNPQKANASRVQLEDEARDTYFTIGSTREDVINIQGAPDSSTEGELRYGSSRVYLLNNHVIGGKSDSPTLKYRPALTSGAKDFFTIGSTKAEVISIEGTPTEGSEDVFRYGSSSVSFSDGLVSGWISLEPKLRVRLRPLSPPKRDYFSVGSTRTEVIAIQGTPDTFSESVFRYGSSFVYFKGGKVESWSEVAPPLKAK